MSPKQLFRFGAFAPLLVFAFSLTAFVFSLLAINSKEWAVRHNYDPLYAPSNWTQENVIYTLHRSPFILCSASANITEINSTSTEDDPQTLTSYTVHCNNFKPFGFNRTSCELEVATRDDTAANLGDTRLCQQIHYAGNFGIASTAFISLGFILTSIATIATFAKLLRSPKRHKTASPAIQHQDKTPGVDQDVIEEAQSPIPGHTAHPAHTAQSRSSIIPLLNLTLITFLSIGVITALISQFYAVEGLMQSSYNNADFATSQGTSASEVQISGLHGPWFQGKALSVFATCAWGFSAAAGSLAACTWRLPKFEPAI